MLVWCRNQGLEPPSRLERIVGSARRAFDQRFCEDTVSMLPPDTIDALTALGAGADGVLSALKSDPGKVGLETVLVEIDKLTAVRSVGVPDDLFVDRSEKLVEAWRARAIRMYPSDFSDTQLPVRLTLLAVLCWTRTSEITDSLIDVLMSLIHKINTRAERRVDKQLVADLRRVRGKDSLLFRVAEESLKRPDDKVRDVVFPLVGERRLQDLVKEAKANERAFQAQVRTVLRGSYTNHYRRMMPSMLAALTFRSNNSAHRPVLDALDLLGRYAETGSKARFYDVGDHVPIDGVVPRAWREAVEDEQGRVERVPYELCVLVALKDGIRRREIFVEGANRWRNPEHDLPPEFDAARDAHYAALAKPLDPTEFINDLKTRLADALERFDTGLAEDQRVG